MIGMNGRWAFSGLLFCFVDGLLVMTGVFLGSHLRFLGRVDVFLSLEYLVWKVMLIVAVVQMSYYYFDLYDFRTFRQKRKMLVTLLKSLGASTIFLSLVYYLVPILTIGRGIFAISLLLIGGATLCLRVLYTWVVRSRVLKERILIVGTGALAKRIRGEILKNGNDSFEIIGFIDENRERVGTTI